MHSSAFRFYPLLPHSDFGLVLHPFDLATNKMLAVVGRVEVRDRVDALECHRKLSPLGLWAWAACGKDEGWSPQFILEEAARAAPQEMSRIEWEGERPDFFAWKQEWRAALAEAHATSRILPPEEAGKAVLDEDGSLFRSSNEVLAQAVEDGRLRFHEGHIGGAWPQIKAWQVLAGHAMKGFLAQSACVLLDRATSLGDTGAALPLGVAIGRRVADPGL